MLLCSYDTFSNPYAWIEGTCICHLHILKKLGVLILKPNSYGQPIARAPLINYWYNPIVTKKKRVQDQTTYWPSMRI